MAKLRRLKLSYTDDAIGHIRQIGSYIRQRNVSAAGRVVTAIRTAAERLTRFPEIGHTVPDAPGTREWIVSGFPYVLVYRADLDDQEITILAVYHAAQDRQSH